MMWTYIDKLYSLRCFIADHVQDCIEMWRMTGDQTYLIVAEDWIAWLDRVEANDARHLQ